MTIEHIAPENSTELPEHEIISIGNLMLLSKEKNSALGSKSFSIKKSHFDDIALWKDAILENAVSWKSDQIQTRGRLLAELAYDKVWKF